MARGVFIGTGILKGKGVVDIFTDTTTTRRLWCLTRRDEWVFVSRERVVFTKKG